MLTSPTVLRNKLLAVDADIGGLPGRHVMLLGFRDPNSVRVEENVRVLREAPGWTVIDARSPRDDLGEVLGRTLPAPKLALVLDAKSAIPSDAAALLRALHDAQETVRWASGATSAIPAKCLLYVVVSGARDIRELPAIMQRIDYMAFIEPPR